MTETSLDIIPVSQLPSRYSVNRSVVYTRLKELKIKPQKIGKQSYIKGTELDLLDRLDEHLKNGGITSEFLAMIKEEPDSGHTQDKRAGDTQDESLDTSPTSRDKALYNEGIALEKLSQDSNQTQPHTLAIHTGQDLQIEPIIQSIIIQTLAALNQQRTEQSTPIDDLETLQKVLDNGWLLTTTKLAQIIGLSPKTIGQKKQNYYCGFVFTKVGRQGKQSLWKIEREK